MSNQTKKILNGICLENSDFGFVSKFGFRASDLTHYSRTTRKKSVTVIELIVVITIMGALGIGFANYLSQAMRIWKFLSYRSEVVNQVRLGMLRASADIRLVNNRTSVEQADAANFIFNATSGRRIGLVYDTNAKILYYNEGGPVGGLFTASNPLISGLTVFNFDYFDKNGNPTSGYNNTTSFIVGVNATVAAGGESASMNIKVYPRNFR